MQTEKCYDIQDIFKKVLKKDRIVDERTFRLIVKTYMENQWKMLFEQSECRLPFGSGSLKMIQYDYKPWYDTKTDTVHAGFKHKPFPYHELKRMRRMLNNVFVVRYYRGTKTRAKNMFWMYTFRKCKAVRQKMFEMTESGELGSLFYKSNNKH